MHTDGPSRKANWHAEIGKLELSFLAALLLYVFLRATSVSLLYKWGVLGVSLFLGGWVSVRWTRRLLRRVIWKVRNRLLVAYLFIAVVPIVLILALAVEASRNLAGQIAVYLVNSELDRRLLSLRGAARTLARAPAEYRAMVLNRITFMLQDRFPQVEAQIIESPKRMPLGASSANPPQEWPHSEGLMVKQGLLYAWAHDASEGRQVTVMVPITRNWLAGLVPEIGEVSIVHFPEPLGLPAARHVTIRLHDPPDGTAPPPRLAPPVNVFDIELVWGTRIPVAVWEAPQDVASGLLAVHSRMSSVIRILFSQRGQSGDLLPLLYTLAVLVLVAELISLVIGVSITRTITDAVEELYAGTQKVMRGDFSHRIQVRGNEQIAELSRSFNQMTENVERLLIVAKEKERMQADLEIAREVQSQLFPKRAPTMPCLEIHAICHPARLVSGDYYDFQMLNDWQVAIAVGDVAGKGISAALLMATLQAALRSQLREARERAGRQGSPLMFCSSGIVSKINQQLYEDTSPEKYATFFFAIYDDATGALTYTNAGHLPPVLIRKRQAERLEVNGLVVGAFPFARYQESRVSLEPGDILVCFTDGLTEPENEFGEQFGEQRLIDALIRHSDLPADKLIAELTAEVRRFTGAAHKDEMEELQDDMTVLVARRLAA